MRGPNMNRIPHTFAVIPQERALAHIAGWEHEQYLLVCDKNFHFSRHQIVPDNRSV
jgi:hypothetical protein